ncbi:heparinase II/III-like protein [Dyadobacter jejuensis]|uniref:Heparinase II/III-like protein n=1 Tax=Dyadobacter jejuensis TaxID=1082580 RepID=A0A316BA08_9BACT|nr:alginate lyase family protein [Dyadobacter jejuensis]PWJ59377.1 heparinase II/III-like protein [Dyadobacter jejuensis]
MNLIHRVGLLLAFIVIPFYLQAQVAWQQATTVEDICKLAPETMHKMLKQYNLDTPGLEGVRSAYKNGDLEQACSLLLQFYRQGTHAAHLRRTLPKVSGNRVALADTILNNVFVIQNVRGQVPYGADGHRDWYYKGPHNDREWAWLSNRHTQISQVLDSYFATGNPVYPQYIDLFLRDFILKSAPYPAKKSGTSVWRGLEVAARAKVWSKIFYGLLHSEYLSDATRLLMLSSLPDHAHYNRHFHAGNNWLTMEISALATVATNFPEYKESAAWLDYSIGAMVESMKGQVYPDGVQTELTSHYHNVSLANFELFKDICDRANKPLPDFYNQTILDMYGYISRNIRPDGFRALNNDGDRGSDRKLLLAAAQKYQRPEWAYLASNGESGARPKEGPSYVHPWAGQLVSRSGYDHQAHWSFFDIGPWGSGHQHNDMLHLSVAAYGRDFLVDAGRFAYTGEVADKFRPYAKGSAGHNVLLFDGKGQSPGPRLADKPLDMRHYKITPDYDYAANSMADFQDLNGKLEHTRAVTYVRGQFWVVVDRVTTDRPRKVEALWHWHPSTVVEAEGPLVKTNHPKGNLAVIPMGAPAYAISLVKGQEKPDLQGWYSPEYNQYEPNVASIYETEVPESTTLVWLLLPYESTLPEIKTGVLSVDAQQVRIEVSLNGKTWNLAIPYQQSDLLDVTSH